jgi:hypothetical protein
LKSTEDASNWKLGSAYIAPKYETLKRALRMPLMEN